MEKSLLSFAATYPTWEPDAAAKQMLMALGQAPPLRGPSGASADLASMQSAVAASLFPGAPRSSAFGLHTLGTANLMTVYTESLCTRKLSWVQCAQ